MNRRQLLGSVASGTAGLLITPALKADITCYPPVTNAYGYSVQNCDVGIPSHLMHYVAAMQEQDQWCWAACIQMMFRVYGYDLPQHQLVQQTWGSIVNMPAYPEQIMAALNRGYVDTRGRPFWAYGDAFTVSIATAIQDLANRSPLIVGALGHATVLTALNYTQSNAGELQVNSAIVRDPWPTSPSRRELTPEEWYGISFAARVRCEPA